MLNVALCLETWLNRVARTNEQSTGQPVNGERGSLNFSTPFGAHSNAVLVLEILTTATELSLVMPKLTLAQRYLYQCALKLQQKYKKNTKIFFSARSLRSFFDASASVSSVFEDEGEY